jgi:hypothetical protein
VPRRARQLAAKRNTAASFATIDPTLTTIFVVMTTWIMMVLATKTARIVHKVAPCG